MNMFLELKSIYKSFNDVKILEDITFNLKQGERVCLFGASGSGKSSLLYISAGILKQDSGEVFINGEKLDTEEHILEARKKYFGFIFQSHNLIPELTVYENIAITQEICGKKDKNFIDFLLNELKIYEKRNQKPQTLSGGEAQRASVARAFSAKPSIVFADEPTGSLDPETAEKTMDLILFLAKQFNASLLSVSHNHNFKPKFDLNFEIKNRAIYPL